MRQVRPRVVLVCKYSQLSVAGIRYTLSQRITWCQEWELSTAMAEDEAAEAHADAVHPSCFSFLKEKGM